MIYELTTKREDSTFLEKLRFREDTDQEAIGRYAQATTYPDDIEYVTLYRIEEDGDTLLAEYNREGNA